MSPRQTSGVATVMFTDLEASTDTTTRLGDDAAAAFFAAHDRIVRGQLEAHGGRRVKSTGDGFLALFDSPRSAIACALAIQHDLAAQQDGPRVRIGINAGEVREAESELFGAAINLASRVMDRAAGGEILVTDTVRQLAGTMPDTRFRDRGRVALKGFPQRQRLHQVTPAEGSPAPLPRAPRRRRSRRPALAAAALAIGAVAAAAVLLTTGGGGETEDLRPNSVAILDRADGHVIGQIPVGVRPTDVVAGDGSVWVANAGDNTVTEIGARSRRVKRTLPTGISVDGLGTGPSGVWVADNERAKARVIDPDFRNVAAELRIGESASAAQAARPVAVTADAVWISYGYGEIARVDPDRKRVVKRFSIGNDPSAVAVGAGAVWVADSWDGAVTRIDPRTNEIVEKIPVGRGASGLAVGAGGVWVAVPLEDRVKLINPETNAIDRTVAVDGGPAAIAIGAGFLWVTSRRGGTLTRVDPAVARVTRTTRLGNSPQGVAIVDGTVWVALQASAAPAPPAGGRANVITMLRPSILGSTDPLVGFPPLDQVKYATCALLLNYPDEPSPAGSRLYPEVAREMPTVSDGGRRYTFHLRSGFRFSPPSNEPVTADAFRRAIERALHPTMESGASLYMNDVAGFDAYASGRAERLAGVAARGDTLTIRLKAPSTTLPARLATTTFCAVPPNTPIVKGGVEEIPMAGPYYFASWVPKRRLVLRRNPNYHGSRPARVDAIDIDLDVNAARAWPAVEAGRADYVSAVPVESVSELEQRYGANSAAARAGGQRYFSGPSSVLHFFEFNTDRSLFARKRMRLAVNAALDRHGAGRQRAVVPRRASWPPHRPVHPARSTRVQGCLDQPTRRPGPRPRQAPRRRRPAARNPLYVQPPAVPRAGSGGAPEPLGHRDRPRDQFGRCPEVLLGVLGRQAMGPRVRQLLHRLRGPGELHRRPGQARGPRAVRAPDPRRVAATGRLSSRRVRATRRRPRARRHTRAVRHLDHDRLLLRSHRLPGPPADLRHLARRAVPTSLIPRSRVTRSVGDVGGVHFDASEMPGRFP